MFPTYLVRSEETDCDPALLLNFKYKACHTLKILKNAIDSQITQGRVQRETVNLTFLSIGRIYFHERDNFNSWSSLDSSKEDYCQSFLMPTHDEITIDRWSRLK